MNGKKLKKLKQNYKNHKRALFVLSGVCLDLDEKIKELEQIIDLDTRCSD